MKRIQGSCGNVHQIVLATACAALALHCGQASAQKAGSAPCAANATAVSVADFGAKADGSSDNMQPFAAALAYASRCSVRTVRVPAGTYLFTPARPATGLLLPSNIALVGDGSGKTVLKVSADKPGADYDSLLWARNQDNVEIRGMTMVGNNVVVNNAAGQPLNSYGSAISVALDEKATSPAFGTPRNLKHFVVADCEFDNFNGAAWIRVTNYHPSFAISDIAIRNNRFVSRPGNAVNPSVIGFTSFAISVMGSRNSADGLVTQVRITGNTMEATHIKGGVGLWSGVSAATVSDNSIMNAGRDDAIPDDRGAYAISVYNNAYTYDKGQTVILGGRLPEDVRIERNVIARPRSCGIYLASPKRVRIVGNKISGQTDGKNQTLPKGAIVLNYATDATVTDNQVSSNHIGISLLTKEDSHVSLSNNNITDVPAGGFATFGARAH